MNYPINFTKSFFVFWIAAAALAYYVGGWINVAFILIALGMIACHEYAHAVACVKNDLKIKEMGFTWLGGYVRADVNTPTEAVDFFMAGIKNTGWFAVVFTAALIFVNIAGRTFLSINFAPTNVYLSLLNTLTLFSIMMLACNVLPISYHDKKHDVLVTTDWFAATMYKEMRDELWNDGKNSFEAISPSFS